MAVTIEENEKVLTHIYSLWMVKWCSQNPITTVITVMVSITVILMWKIRQGFSLAASSRSTLEADLMPSWSSRESESFALCGQIGGTRYKTWSDIDFTRFSQIILKLIDIWSKIIVWLWASLQGFDLCDNTFIWQFFLFFLRCCFGWSKTKICCCACLGILAALILGQFESFLN